MVVDPDANVMASGGAILWMPCPGWAVVGQSQSLRPEVAEEAVSRGQPGAAAVCWTDRSHYRSWAGRKERQSRGTGRRGRSVWDRGGRPARTVDATGNVRQASRIETRTVPST